MLAKHYATHTRENDLDREEKLGKAEKFANQVIEMMKTLPKARIGQAPPLSTLPMPVDRLWRRGAR
jgi:hypothetical protein